MTNILLNILLVTCSIFAVFGTIVTILIIIDYFR